MPALTDTFKCENCDKTFATDREWSEADMATEYTANWGINTQPTQRFIVCERCYKDLMKRRKTLGN